MTGRSPSRTFHEVYVWWCGVQGAEPYPPDSPYCNPDGDGHYVDAYAIWTEFCHD